MSRLFIQCVSILFLCATLYIAAGIGVAQALTIQSIRGGTHPDKTRLVIELDQVADFRVQLIDLPRRLRVELPADQVDPRAAIELGKLGITELRQEKNGGMIRLDFVLQSPVKIISAFMLPRSPEKPDRLVVDYRKIPAAEFKAETGNSLGTLDSGRSGNGILGVLNRNTGSSGASAAPRNNNTGDERTRTGAAPAANVETDDGVELRGPRKYIVVIDAGHGGKDPGAIGVDGIFEKNVTLAAARELAQQLNETGRYKAVLTRGDDRFILLPERVRIARRANADLFISLHADMAADGRHTDGLSIYTLSDKSSDEQTARLAAAENKVDLLAGVDLSGQQEDVANILIDLAMRENMNQSRFFAGKIVKTLATRGVRLLEKPHRYAGFAVLKAPDIPSVLVEMGFLSNPEEARRLQDATHRRRLMEGLVNGIDSYFSYLQKNAQL